MINDFLLFSIEKCLLSMFGDLSKLKKKEQDQEIFDIDIDFSIHVFSYWFQTEAIRSKCAAAIILELIANICASVLYVSFIVFISIWWMNSLENKYSKLL